MFLLSKMPNTVQSTGDAAKQGPECKLLSSTSSQPSSGPVDILVLTHLRIREDESALSDVLLLTAPSPQDAKNRRGLARSICKPSKYKTRL